MAPVREVAFELECFEWADERLEVAGRWMGLGSRRLNRPVLTVHMESGRRKRIVALPGGHMGAGAETWRASFAWPGDPADITGAALEVGGSLVVDLPLPDRRRRRRRRPPAEHADEALRAEVGALRGQVERLRAELAGRERELIALRAQLDEDTDEDPASAVAGADERTVEFQRLANERDAARAELERVHGELVAGADAMTVELERLAGERAQSAAELERLAGERDAERAAGERVAEESARLRAEVDELREAFSEAAVEVEAVRDRHRETISALEDQLRAERAQVARLSARLADLPAASIDAGRKRAAAPPTQPLPEPATPAPGGDAAPDAAPAEDTAVPPAIADAPGPLRAGSRPGFSPLLEGEARGSGTPEPLPGPVGDEQAGSTGGVLHALKERIGHLLTSNGHAPDDDGATEEDAGVPLPRRSAAAARARAGATVAARRTPTEMWGMRILAGVFVTALLAAFVLLLVYIA